MIESGVVLDEQPTEVTTTTTTTTVIEPQSSALHSSSAEPSSVAAASPVSSSSSCPELPLPDSRLPDSRLPGLVSRYIRESEAVVDAKCEAVRLIHGISHLLSITQSTRSTACLFLHRYHRHVDVLATIGDERQCLAAASVFLACKVEETPKKLRDVVGALQHLRALGRSERAASSQEASEGRRLSNQVLRYEMDLLVNLAFDLVSPSAYKLLVQMAAFLKCSPQLQQSAWTLLNDSFYLDLCLHHPPHKVALACIFMASQLLQEDVRADPATGVSANWWESFRTAFAIPTSLQDLFDIFSALLDFYQRHAQSEDSSSSTISSSAISSSSTTFGSSPGTPFAPTTTSSPATTPAVPAVPGGGSTPVSRPATRPSLPPLSRGKPPLPFGNHALPSASHNPG